MSGGVSDMQGEGLKWPPFASSAAFVEVAAGRRQIGAADRGAHVKALEEALIGAGYGLPGGAQPDLVFSQGTKSALSRFQRDKGLPQSGALDRATLLALDAAVVAKKGGKGAGPAAAKVDSVKLMNDILAEARTPGSDGGSRITKPELERALSALQWDDGVISPPEFAAAKAALEGEAFQRVATADAKARAAEFLREHAGKAGKAPETALEVLKLDQFQRESALGKGRIAEDAQLALVKLPAAAGGADALPDIVRRALGRQAAAGLAIEPFQVVDPGGLLRALGRKVGEGLPGAGEVQKAASHLGTFAAGGGRVLMADWTEAHGRETTAGTFYVASKPGGQELLIVDVLRAGG
jgi:peptidoglycan hydrolase-like protein with peptidoglycan-binding domain